MSTKTNLVIICIGLLLIMYSTNTGVSVARPAFMWIGIILLLIAIISMVRRHYRHKK